MIKIIFNYIHSNTNKTTNELSYMDAIDKCEYRSDIIELEINKSINDDINALIEEFIKMKI